MALSPGQSSIKSKCVWITNVFGFESIQLSKPFSYYGKIKQIIFADPDKGEALIMYTTEESAQKALEFDGKVVKGNALGVNEPTMVQLESVAKALSLDVPSPKPEEQIPQPDFLSKMQDLDEVGRNRILAMLQNVNDGNQPSGGHRYPYIPRLSQYSGDGVKGDVSYMQWHHEVSCLLTEGNSQATIGQAIRRSLKGSAYEVLMNLRPNVSIQEILNKFDIAFGSALSLEYLLEDFYKSRQKQSESVISWSCRVESLLRLAKDRGAISGDSTDMIRTKFFSGLRDEKVKGGIRHKFENNAPYDDLLKSARSIEQEYQETNVPITNVLSQTCTVDSVDSNLDSKLDKLLSKFDAIEKRLVNVEKQVNVSPTTSRSADVTVKFCRYCKNDGHLINECRKLMYKNGLIKNQGNEHVSTQRGTGLTRTIAPL
jgi:hypothetical protein